MADVGAVAERVWYGRGAGASAARALLTPASLAFAGAARLRNALYDRGAIDADPLGAPTISVGNLTVGGTGKTPVAAWIASRLIDAGAHPAIVLRGYGGDEPLVHGTLNPNVPVVANADRRVAARDAIARGADVLVLDDAFQHRRVRRDVDLVLVSAEQTAAARALLPSGPYREPLSALRRATAVVVTRKRATSADVDATIGAVVHEGGVPRSRVAVVALTLDTLNAWQTPGSSAATAPLASVDGERVLAIAGIGAPRLFFAQLGARGARVAPAAFADHHSFTAADVDALARRAVAVDRVVCTLKDAVKLGPLWPRAAPTLWYVSQRLVVEEGAVLVDELIARLVRARA